MKAFLATLAVLSAQFVSAHCECLALPLPPVDTDNTYSDTIPDLIVNGTTSSDWQFVRKTANFNSQGPVSLPVIRMSVHEN